MNPYRPPAVTALQAAEDSPQLASLLARAKDMSDRLNAVRELIPKDLRPAVQAGPVEDGTWCLLVKGNAAAAKLRHLLPLLELRLKNKGWTQTALRIKVRMHG